MKFFQLRKLEYLIRIKKWIDSDLKRLDRLKKREYTKKGKTERYKALGKDFELKFKKAADNYLEKNVRSLKEADPGKAYSTLKMMEAQPGDD